MFWMKIALPAVVYVLAKTKSVQTQAYAIATAPIRRLGRMRVAGTIRKIKSPQISARPPATIAGGCSTSLIAVPPVDQRSAARIIATREVNPAPAVAGE